MKIITPSFEILGEENLNADVLKKIELCGRVCYKSEDKITSGSAERFVANIIKSGHESVIEHVSASVRFIVDRGVSHEIVRHRVASFSQESSRYCNYGNGEVVFIKPFFFEENSPRYLEWRKLCKSAESAYLRLLELGARPEEARSVLPNSLKTELITTANLREWRHFFKLRTDKAAHPQMREVAIPLLQRFKELIPVVFDDIN